MFAEASLRRPLPLLLLTVLSFRTLDLFGQSTFIESTPVIERVQVSSDDPTSTSSFSLIDAIRIDPTFSTDMLDFQNRQTDKQLFLLEHGRRADGPEVILGGQLRGSFLAATTNRTGKFNYLGRFPGDFVGDSATDARLLHGNLAVATHFGPWTHGYFETLFSDVFSFPTFNQGSFQVRQAYITIGNLNASPYYAFIGKKTVSFGDMSTLSPFTQAMNWHYFAALHEGIGAGFYQEGINLSITAINGGRGIRVADSPSKGKLNNFSVNVSYDWQFSPDGFAQIGGAYLHGTIYDAAIPEHINPALFGPRNGAWDVNVFVRIGQLQLAGELTSTLRPWPATANRVIAYRTEAAFDTWWFGKPSRVSLSWSEGIQGPTGTEFEFNRQLVVGTSTRVSPHALLSLEYVNGLGFAPLINIVTVSDRSVSQHSIVGGIVLTF